MVLRRETPKSVPRMKARREMPGRDFEPEGRKVGGSRGGGGGGGGRVGG